MMSSYASSATSQRSWRSAIATIARSRSSSITAPVGLCGVLTKSATVRAVIADSIASGSYAYASAMRSGTPTGTPPARRMFSATSVHIGSGMITSSPGHSSEANVAYSACIAPFVTKMSAGVTPSMPLTRCAFSASARRSSGMPLFGM